MKSVVVSAMSLGLLVLSVGCSNPSQQQANISPDSTSIVGGKVPTSQEPVTKSIVAIRSVESKMVFCSGSLIAPRLVLTAAHCVQEKPMEVVTGNIGFHPKAETRQVKASIAHAEFSKMTEERLLEIIKTLPPTTQPTSELASLLTLQDDVGLLLLDADAPATWVQIALPTQALTNADIPAMGRISGYGRTKGKISDVANLGSLPAQFMAFYEAIDFSGVLTTLQTVLLTEYQGINTLVSTKKIFSQSLPEQSGCHGDSGGPMTIVKNGKLLQIGVASHLVTDTEEKAASCSADALAYTDVSAYTAWIAEKSAELLKQQ